MIRLAASVFAAASLACATAPRGHFDSAVLLAADTAFDADVAQRGLDAWLDWFEDDAAVWKNKKLLRGKESYRATLGALLARPGAALRWAPVYADGDGAIGFTTGRWTLHEKKDDQDKQVGSGTYVTLWRLQTDGRWRVMFDMGNDD